MCKVIDTKSTLMDLVDYLEQIKDTEMSKVDKGMFVFESWGDRSIVNPKHYLENYRVHFGYQVLRNESDAWKIHKVIKIV